MNKNILKQWTQSAIDCYNIGCDCSKCKLKKNIETNCRMKYMVLELVRIHGKPKEDVLQTERSGKWNNF